MIRLLYNPVQSDNPARKKEYEYCLNKLMFTYGIDEIVCLFDSPENPNNPIYGNHNFRMGSLSRNYSTVHVKERPTFKRIFEILSECSEADHINIFINADCYFDPNSIHLFEHLKENEFWCLSKYDIKTIWPFNATFHQNAFEKTAPSQGQGSQDCWAFRGPLKRLNDMAVDFAIGTPHCDNRIAYEAKKAGYTLRNPSRGVIVYHYHVSAIRNHPPKLTGGMLNVPNHKIEGIPR